MGQQVRVGRSLDFVWRPGQVSHTLTTSDQGIYEESSTQQHPIGSRLQIDDMVFHYCHAEADPTGTSSTILASRAVCNKDAYVAASAITAASAGADSITCTVANTATHAYENGYIIQQPSPWTHNQKLRVMDNTTTVYQLKDGLEQAVTAADSLYFSKNMYADVGKNPSTGNDYARRKMRSFVAVPLDDITPEYYFWGQTWGPCCLQFGSGTYKPGATGYSGWGSRIVYFDYYGAVYPGSENDTDPLAPYNCGRGVQPAGFVIPDSYGTDGTDGWSILIFLQITPL